MYPAAGKGFGCCVGTQNGTNPVAYKVTNLLTAYEQCIEVSLF